MFRAVLASTALHFTVLYVSMLTLPNWSSVDRNFFEVVPVELVATIAEIEDPEEEEPAEPENMEEPEPIPEPEEMQTHLDGEEEDVSQIASVPRPRIKPRHIGLGLSEEEEAELAENEKPEDELLADILDEADSILEKKPEAEPKEEPIQVAQTKTNDVNFDSPTITKAIMTTQIQVAFLSKLKNCWPDVQDLPEPERLIVTVKMQLNQDGTIRGDARLVRPRRVAIGDRPMQQAVERALRAARRCAPYEVPDGAETMYEEWKNVTLVVGPANKKARR